MSRIDLVEPLTCAQAEGLVVNLNISRKLDSLSFDILLDFEIRASDFPTFLG